MANRSGRYCSVGQILYEDGSAEHCERCHAHRITRTDYGWRLRWDDTAWLVMPCAPRGMTLRAYCRWLHDDGHTWAEIAAARGVRAATVRRNARGEV
jgi:hypothetical protein